MKKFPRRRWKSSAKSPRIETERAIVHGNRELIRLYEEKVKKVIERVWEGWACTGSLHGKKNQRN
jgi:hypothetical protein